jgi:NaMN:DMB phosphoribosyltransferase
LNLTKGCDPNIEPCVTLQVDELAIVDTIANVVNEEVEIPLININIEPTQDMQDSQELEDEQEEVSMDRRHVSNGGSPGPSPLFGKNL